MRVVLIALVALLASCVMTSTTTSKGTYTGTYFGNFETSSFTQAGASTSWVVSFDHRSDAERVIAQVGSGPFRARAVFRGRVEQCGGCGNLNASQHIFRVRDVIQFTPIDASQP